MGFFSCICSVLFPTDLQPLADVFNAVISFFILDAISWASLIFLIYLLFFYVTLPWYTKFEGNQNNQHNQHRKRVHFADEVNDPPANEKHITDLRNTRHGEQLFLDGYLQGYRDGKRVKKQVYTQSDSWKEAGEEALEHIRQSFVHDEEELRRAMLG